MTDRLFSELIRDDLGFEISSRTVKKLKPKFKPYKGKMFLFNRAVYFDNELYKHFLNTIKSNAKCQF